MAVSQDDKTLLALYRIPDTKEKGFTLIIQKYQEKLSGTFAEW